MHSRNLLCLGALLLALTFGCAGNKPKSVSGKVTLDGELVKGGSIVFLPAEGDGTKGAAEIVDGSYLIGADNGLKPGKYRVEISWFKPTGRKIPSADPGFTTDETREVIPAKYNASSTLTAEIGAGENKHDFSLTSK